MNSSSKVFLMNVERKEGSNNMAISYYILLGPKHDEIAIASAPP